MSSLTARTKKKGKKKTLISNVLCYLVCDWYFRLCRLKILSHNKSTLGYQLMIFEIFLLQIL